MSEVGGALERLLFIVGDEAELAAAAEYIPARNVAGTFGRPLDVRKFIGHVDRISHDPRSRETRPILLVDDDPDYLMMVKGWLSRKYRVAVVSSGMQALTYLANNKPALILLDYSMPVTSGPQVLEMIRSEPETRKIPVIFLTGKGDSESVRRVLELKPDGYILKSIGRDALLERMDELFSGANGLYFWTNYLHPDDRERFMRSMWEANEFMQLYFDLRVRIRVRSGVYEPVRVFGGVTRKPVGAEALLRWKSDAYGELTPLRFLADIEGGKRLPGAEPGLPEPGGPGRCVISPRRSGPWGFVSAWTTTAAAAPGSTLCGKWARSM